jgi:hypothetical protein
MAGEEADWVAPAGDGRQRGGVTRGERWGEQVNHRHSWR